MTTEPTFIRRSAVKNLLAHQIEIDQRLINEDGAWATLRLDPNGTYVPGLGPQGMFYVEHYSPDFVEGSGPGEMAFSPNRAKATRAIRRWLEERPFSPKQLARIDAELAAQSTPEIQE